MDGDCESEMSVRANWVGTHTKWFREMSVRAKWVWKQNECESKRSVRAKGVWMRAKWVWEQNECESEMNARSKWVWDQNEWESEMTVGPGESNRGGRWNACVWPRGVVSDRLVHSHYMYETMFLTLIPLAKPRCRRHRNLRLPARGPKILNMILLIKMVLLIDYMIIFVKKHKHNWFFIHRYPSNDRKDS